MARPAIAGCVIRNASDPSTRIGSGRCQPRTEHLVASTPSDPERLSPSQLAELLARARDEQWSQLALLSPTAYSGYKAYLIGDGWRADRTFWLNERLGADGARTLAALTSLTALNLTSNSIGDDGVRALTALMRLTSLNLAANSIGDDGARTLSALTSLTALNLGSNGIGADGARALAALTNLTSLDLYNNDIGAGGARSLMEAWVDAPTADRLKYLDLRANGDLTTLLPEEVINSTDAQAILAAYRRYRDGQQQQTLEPLNEAKLLVVGNEAVGKTSLIRYLVDGTPRNPNEPKTPGAAIREKIETKDWKADGSAVTLHVWDFGGQEIMHGTHRFFLTERSIYLLVLEARREDDRSVYDWLKTINNRGGDSPVIVVVNKSDLKDHALRLDETGLKKEYPGIMAFVRTSCDPGPDAAASIAVLRQLIAQTLATDTRLKHVRDPIPDSWLRVKQAVAELARQERVLKLRDFERFCEQPVEGAAKNNSDLITDEAEQRALLRLLNDLGAVVAHGLERDAHAVRREITLLDPNWLTGAIYTLLNSPKVRDQGGEFGRDQLPELLDPGLYPSQWYEFILDMMQDDDIGLCFKLPGVRGRGERYLIPEALPSNEPEYGAWPAESLKFRIQYEFLPPGLMPRFIVQAHRNLTRNPTRWRTGVVLGAADCQILVRADRDRRRMEIAVAGPATRQRSALNVVLDDLDEVHARNPGTEPRPVVPLPEEPDKAVSYEHLLKLEARYGLDHEFDPEDAERPYTVRELLEGVRRDRSSFRDEGDPPKRFSPREPGPTAAARTEPAATDTRQAVYVSYAWGDPHETGPESREDIVERLCGSLTADGYDVRRDKHHLGYQGSITEFMQEIGRGACIIVVVSDKSLRSTFCMYEVLEVDRNRDFRKRVCPVVLSDAKIHSAADRLAYVAHWQEEYNRLHALIEKVGLNGVSIDGSLKEREKLRDIAQAGDKLFTILADMNARTPQIVEANNFELLKRAIADRMQQLAANA